MELRGMNQILTGFLVAFFSIAIVLGSFALTQAESKPHPLLVSNPMTPPQTMAITINPDAQELVKSTAILMSLTPSKGSPFCPAPIGWQEITVDVDDTLERIAAAYDIAVADLEKANCLVSLSLIPGTSLYIPPAPTKTVSTTPTVTPTEDKRPRSTSTPEMSSCRPPPSWVLYTVTSGDTLYKLSQMYLVSITQLQEANCLGASTLLRGGQQIYVPNVPALLPSKTAKPTQKPPTSEPATTEPPVVPGTDEPIATESNE